MSASTTPNDSPISAPIQPLHNPRRPLKSNGCQGSPRKENGKEPEPDIYLADRQLNDPLHPEAHCAKRKHFTKGAKPIQLFASTEEQADESDDDSRQPDQVQPPQLPAMEVDDENPF
ncbi:hypothetical protein K438DRAFT_2017169 [Mycena galopus ATCC 62051]|nr:hypothetical protein K438DRAFT_2017169 [Mycena galopus ATCC 62051]